MELLKRLRLDIDTITVAGSFLVPGLVRPLDQPDRLRTQRGEMGNGELQLGSITSAEAL
jgi:hypothetical protein